MSRRRGLQLAVLTGVGAPRCPRGQQGAPRCAGPPAGVRVSAVSLRVLRVPTSEAAIERAHVSLA
jgi:hypothetical protein